MTWELMGVLLLLFAGLRDFMGWTVHLGRHLIAKDMFMPSVEVSAPVSAAPADRLALGVGWSRPGVAGIGGTLNPSFPPGRVTPSCLKMGNCCFEGGDE